MLETVDYYYGVGTGFAEESDTTYYDWVACYGATAKGLRVLLH